MESSLISASQKITHAHNVSPKDSSVQPLRNHENSDPGRQQTLDSARYIERVNCSIASSIRVKQRLLDEGLIAGQLSELSALLVEAVRAGNKPILFGNGGSAADAQHIAAEFIGRFGFDRPALPALALSVNTSCVTAIGNDYGYDRVFARQIEALARPGDVAIGISTSGNSRSVLLGLEAARRSHLLTVALTGETGGQLKDAADFCICVPSTETPRIQECHILIGHVLAQLVEEEIFGAESCISRS
jgi:D-sedoheptulose 7-phosphate isomerase